MKTVAVVPVKTISERVESKNFRDFFEGLSLFDILIKQLKESNTFDEIYVSSNSNKIEDTLSTEGIKFIKREDRFCNNNIPWSDVIAHVASSLPEESDTTLAWCHTTSPTFNNFSLAIDKYEENLKKGYDGLITVIKSSDFIVSGSNQPLNYSWGPWHKYSQFLDSYYYITGALFISSIDQMIKNRYVISKNPFLFEVSPFEAIDIDTEYDFELAKILMKNSDILKNKC
tara:strand:- start:415 stop:1101 length:687 start_codon:yes stop_codon:yes gene_type:complete